MEKRSGETFSEELLEDIRLEIEEHKGDHLLDLYREVQPQLSLLQETPPVELHHSVAAIEVDGHRTFVGDGAGNVMVYELLKGAGVDSHLTPEPVASTVLHDGPVVNMGLMKAHELLMVCSPCSMHALSTACEEAGVIGLRPLRLSHPCESKEMTLKVHGDLVGVTSGPAHLLIYRVEGVRDGQVLMHPVADFDTPHGIFRWKIWNNQILCVLRTGSVAVWDLTKSVFSLCSEPYSELRYQNPCWLFQRYVLSSSELSRNLLSRYVYMMPTCPAAYWHISCGPAYWLFGRLDEPLPDPQKFRGVLPPDVTALCMRRRLLACARRSPYQIMVYALPPDMPHNRDALTLALQTPLITLDTPEHVLKIDLAFDGPQIHLFVCTQPGHLYCYSLER